MKKQYIIQSAKHVAKNFLVKVRNIYMAKFVKENTKTTSIGGNCYHSNEVGGNPSDLPVWVIEDKSKGDTYYIVAETEEEALAIVRTLKETNIFNNWSIRLGKGN